MELDKIKAEITERYQMLIDYHKEMAKEHLEEVAKWENGLKVLLGNEGALKTVNKVFHGVDVMSPQNKQPTTPKNRKIKSTHGKKRSNRQTAPSTANLLADTSVKYAEEQDKPLSANELREKYNGVSGKDISVTNFSPRVSELVKKGLFFMFTIEGNPIKSKFVYALPRMIDEEGKLKEEYLRKVKAGIQLPAF